MYVFLLPATPLHAVYLHDILTNSGASTVWVDMHWHTTDAPTFTRLHFLCRHLENNGLTGDLPAGDVWDKLWATLTTMYVETCKQR